MKHGWLLTLSCGHTRTATTKNQKARYCLHCKMVKLVVGEELNRPSSGL